MNKAPIETQLTPQQLLAKLLETEALLAVTENKYQRLLEQFRLAQHHRFGKSSEVSPEQASLFNEAEEECDKDEPADVETVTYTRNKPKRKPLPAELPRTVIVHDIPDEDKTCDCCGHDLHKIGEDISEKLEFVPAKVEVQQHIRPKYACRHCETHNTTTPIKQAPVPPSPIPKGIATPSLLSQIITAKYQYHMPLYRQETQFAQWGLHLSRRTMSDWMMKSSQLLQALFDKIKSILIRLQVLHADETTLNVLSEEKAKCYMWVYCSGTDSPGNYEQPNIVLYDYRVSRHGYHAADFLDGFNGYLHCDGYQGYAQTKATLVGCWAHARRKFVEAQRVQVKGKVGSSDWAINHIKKLYRLEVKLKGQSEAEKYQQRQEVAAPLLNTLKEWLDKAVMRISPKTKLGEAISYTLNQWPKLIRYIEDGQLSIDNNRAERAVKPFVMGRKNWMFSNTPSGAQASAVLYSIIETAKANGLMPFDYINHCLTQLAIDPNEVESLLPWNVNLNV